MVWRRRGVGGVHEAGAWACKRGRGLRPLAEPVMREVRGGGARLEVTLVMRPGHHERLTLCGKWVVMTRAWTGAVTVPRALALGVGEGSG